MLFHGSMGSKPSNPSNHGITKYTPPLIHTQDLFYPEPMTNICGCSYSLQYSWWWTQIASETFRVITPNKREKSCMSLVFIWLVLVSSIKGKAEAEGVRTATSCVNYGKYVAYVFSNAGMSNWGSPRAIWVTFVLPWGPHTTTNWSHLIKIIAEYFCFYSE